MRLSVIILLGTMLIPSATWSGPVFLSDNVFSPNGFDRPHGASLVELDNGDLFATWFSSRIETGSDARIFGARWGHKTHTWTAPRTIIPDDYSKSVGNTALFKDDDGILWMFFAAVRIGGWSGSMIDYVQSPDEGESWSEGKTLVYHLGNLPRNLPIRVGDHAMLAPFFIDFMYEANLVGSYTALIKYKDGEILEKTYASVDDYDSIQPTLVKLPDKRILMLTRDKSDRFVRRAYSTNGGKSWSDVTITTVPNPGSAISAIFVEEINAVLLAYNHSRVGRNPLSLAISMDSGKTFKRIINLESNPSNPKASYSYPTIIKTRDGMIHIIWSHDNRSTLKHVRFNIEWLRNIATGPKPGATQADIAGQLR